MKKAIYPIKFLLFVICFFMLSFAVSFILKDDSSSYSRVLIHDFYNQKNIDYILCGASHVSHGLDSRIADIEFQKTTFSTGTPNQQLNSTYAIIKQAIKTYKIQKVFLELDFATASMSSREERNGFKSAYIASGFLRDIPTKIEFYKDLSTPEYYLNSILPIGKDKLLTLEPNRIFSKIKSVFTGDYFKYEYKDSKSEYAGSGCVLDLDVIKNGTFTEKIIEKPIEIPSDNESWQYYIKNIIEICEKNNVELIFYEMAGSDFYLNEKTNYDEYYSYVKDFVAQFGYEFYDFNLAKPDFYNPADEDFSDDNHLNKQGVENFTKAFCKFFKNQDLKSIKNDYFYSSYKEKMDCQEGKIFGVVLHKNENKMEIKPILNKIYRTQITYDCFIDYENPNKHSEQILQTTSSEIDLSSSSTGTFTVKCYVDGKLTNTASRTFTTF